MGRRVKVNEASKLVGLSEYAIRKGIREGRYPYIRTGIGAGKIIIDIDLLEQYLSQEAMQNASAYVPVADNVIHYRQLRRAQE